MSISFESASKSRDANTRSLPFLLQLLLLDHPKAGTPTPARFPSCFSSCFWIIQKQGRQHPLASLPASALVFGSSKSRDANTRSLPFLLQLLLLDHPKAGTPTPARFPSCFSSCFWIIQKQGRQHPLASLPASALAFGSSKSRDANTRSLPFLLQLLLLDHPKAGTPTPARFPSCFSSCFWIIQKQGRQHPLASLPASALAFGSSKSRDANTRSLPFLLQLLLLDHPKAGTPTPARFPSCFSSCFWIIQKQGRQHPLASLPASALAFGSSKSRDANTRSLPFLLQLLLLDHFFCRFVFVIVLVPLSYLCLLLLFSFLLLFLDRSYFFCRFVFVIVLVPLSYPFLISPFSFLLLIMPLFSSTLSLPSL